MRIRPAIATRPTEQALRPLTRTIVLDRLGVNGLDRKLDHAAGLHTSLVLGCPGCC